MRTQHEPGGSRLFLGRRNTTRIRPGPTIGRFLRRERTVKRCPKRSSDVRGSRKDEALSRLRVQGVRGKSNGGVGATKGLKGKKNSSSTSHSLVHIGTAIGGGAGDLRVV